MFLTIVQKIVAMLARRVIRQYKPEIIGISGSVGKTSTKEAIASMLSVHFRVRETYKNYNNELGLPLSILGLKSPGKSLLGWLRVFQQAWHLGNGNVKDEYPEVLVLEMGVDHPGDMDYLASIARPTRSVITKLGQAHLEFFKSLEHLHAEKMKLAQVVSDEGWVIYNYDDEVLRKAVEKVPRRNIGFGFDAKAEVCAEQTSIVIGQNNEIGTAFKLKIEGSTVPIFLPGVIGRPPVYSALAAAAVAMSYGINAVMMADIFIDRKRPAGRLQLIPGINDSLIIDDTYNSSPDSVFEGLNAIADVPKEKRQRVWTVLGSMKELGDLSTKGHEDVAKAAAKVADFIIAVGEEARVISDTWFATAEEAAMYLKDKIKPGDVLFIKGSQAARMEKVVKVLMAQPERAEELLVRQGKEWSN